MERLTNWKARRSGGRITITSTDAPSQRWPNIDTIEVKGGKIIATDKHGVELQLIP